MTSKREPTVQFILELAAALNIVGESVTINQARAARIAAAYGVSDARVAVLPNLVLAAGGRGRPTVIEFARMEPLGLRLDRTAAVADLAEDAELARVEPGEGLLRLEAIATMQHRFGIVGVIAGHMVLTIGLTLILQPTPEAIALSAFFGALVGALKAYTRNLHTVGVLLPVTAATLVSALAFWLAPDQTIDGSMRVLIPALVTFLPGGLLTTATLDLSAGQVISGASQLVAGSMQLVLLSFGMVAGAQIAGVPADVAITNEAKNTLGDWAPWLGVVVFGIGAFVHFSGPRGALRWLLLVLFSAYLGQEIGAAVTSDAFGGFFGALVVTPVAAWVATRKSGPPALATFLPAFWLIVPGAVSLIGIAEFFGSDREAGLNHVVDTIVVFVAIGLGVLVGNAIVLRWRGLSQ